MRATTGGRGRKIKKMPEDIRAMQLAHKHIQALGANIKVNPEGLLSTAKGVGRGIGHVGSGTSRGLYRGITGLPTGVYMAGRGVGHDVGQAAHGDLSFKRSRAIGKAMAQATARDFTHFGEGGDLSGPTLDFLALLSAGGGGVSRISAAGKAGKAASYANKAARIPRPIDIAVAKARLGNPWSESELAQKGLTKAQVKEHDARLGEAGYTLQTRGQFASTK